MRYKLILIAGIFLQFAAYSISNGQSESFEYRRTIEEVSDAWHSLELPDDLFGKAKKNLEDLRIIGFNSEGDTIEVPYFVNVLKDKVVQKEVVFNVFNKAVKDDKYVFYIEVPSQEKINKIDLNFNELNFDYKVLLEGGQNMNDWFRIVDDYRITSLKNNLTDYTFTTLSFPNSVYRYYKISIEYEKRPQLSSASVKYEESIPGEHNYYSINSQNREEDRKQKQSIVNFNLKLPVPVSSITLNVEDTIDYYRPFYIQYLSDSVQSPKGWKYQFRTAYKGTLSSLEKSEFSFPAVTASKWKVVINNNDNAPLKLGTSIVKGYKHIIIARFSEPANYYLMYGNESLRPPVYDIENFKDNIPVQISSLHIGEEDLYNKKFIQKASPFFQNPFWLWGIMAIIIMFLVVFAMRMIRNTN